MKKLFFAVLLVSAAFATSYAAHPPTASPTLKTEQSRHVDALTVPVAAVLEIVGVVHESFSVQAVEIVKPSNLVYSQNPIFMANQVKALFVCNSKQRNTEHGKLSCTQGQSGEESKALMMPPLFGNLSIILHQARKQQTFLNRGRLTT
jgi:hypothetical protein